MASAMDLHKVLKQFLCNSFYNSKVLYPYGTKIEWASKKNVPLDLHQYNQSRKNNNGF